MTADSSTQSYYQRNFWCFAFDFCFFGIAMAFIGPGTVVPGLLSELGASAFIIGFVSSLQRAGWLLPQLIGARYLANKPYKKPYILWPSVLGRPLYLVLAGITWGFGNRNAKLTITVFLLIYTLFWIVDGLSSLSWFDLLSKSIPTTKRGRVTSVGQTLSGVFSFLAGIGVEWVLSNHGLKFPHNYASLFLIGFGMLFVSTIVISFIKETSGESEQEVPSWRDYIPQLGAVLKNDHRFRRYIIARQLFNLHLLATPFYVTYALDVLNLPDQVVGRYTSIGVVGGVLSAWLFGWINEHRGTKIGMLVSTLVTSTIPLTALLVPQLTNDPVWLGWLYGLVFFVLHAAGSSLMPTWLAFVLELAPEVKRPVYVGLTNTINGVTTVFSTLGGLILQWSDSNYQMLFILTAFGTLLSLQLLLKLPEPRD